ncbi:hypothetical protein EKH55_5344 [Sinorhizobium alkalisoli]|nr:hypothetical protein EKH55_5344 [Sinorhizobium alkalisoli]
MQGFCHLRLPSKSGQTYLRLAPRRLSEEISRSCMLRYFTGDRR